MLFPLATPLAPGHRGWRRHKQNLLLNAPAAVLMNPDTNISDSHDPILVSRFNLIGFRFVPGKAARNAGPMCSRQ